MSHVPFKDVVVAMEDAFRAVLEGSGAVAAEHWLETFNAFAFPFGTDT